MIVETPPQPKKHRSHGNPEAKIQAECVTWLWNERPETRGTFIHIPNEGNRRSKMDGAVRKALGVLSGASDCFLFLARKGFYGLAVEFKTETGTQSEAQKTFQVKLELNGYKYVIIRSLEAFKKTINWYLD